jgi:transposase
VTCIQKEVKAKIVYNHNLPTIKRIPDKLWDEFKKVLPKEKPQKTVGRPVVPYRRVLDGILYVLRTGCQWKMLPKEYGSGSASHRRDVFKIIFSIFYVFMILSTGYFSNARRNRMFLQRRHSCTKPPIIISGIVK